MTHDIKLIGLFQMKLVQDVCNLAFFVTKFSPKLQLHFQQRTLFAFPTKGYDHVLHYAIMFPYT